AHRRKHRRDGADGDARRRRSGAALRSRGDDDQRTGRDHRRRAAGGAATAARASGPRARCTLHGPARRGARVPLCQAEIRDRPRFPGSKTGRAGSMSRSVFLIGAGPGDPELMTLKAARALGKADVVLIDDLVSRGCLAHARSDAKVIEVGKRGGCKATPQEFIERLMVQYARQGKIVARRAYCTIRRDRKSTRLNSSHLVISYAVFCLKKKKKDTK